MSSEIESIWDALQAQTITLNGRAIPCTGLDNPPGMLSSAQLPLRILHPYDDRAEGRDFHFRTLGTQVKGLWVVVDFCAFAPIAATQPLRAMLRYEVAYHAMLASWRAAGGATDPAIKATLKPWHTKQGAWEWPIQSQQFYHGVQIIIELDELFQAEL